MTFTTRMLTPETWDDFAALVEASNGVWGGCWCMGFHPEGVSAGRTREGNREAKRRHVTRRTVRQVLVYDGDRCVGWCQFGSQAELPNIKNRGAYDRGAERSAGLADWLRLHQREGPRQGRRRRCGRGGARGDQAGRRRRRRGLSEEQTGQRPPQRGAYLHTGPEELYAQYGFTRVRQIAKWRWVMRTKI